MDCGSTVFRLCQFIKNKNIKVITNSLPVIYELQNCAVSINIIGGEFNSKRQAVHGKIANEHIARYRAGKAFLGVDGISEPTAYLPIVSWRPRLHLGYINQSAYTYVLCDAGKVGNETYLKFAGIDQVEAIITNAGDEKLDEFKDTSISVLTSK
jgi:DeoR family fructose operon transcriptional repressor